MSNKGIKQVVIKENDFSSDDEPPEPINPATLSGQFPDYLTSPDGRPANSILPGMVSLEFMNRHFPDATLSDWCDWRWQLRNSVKSFKRLKDFLNIDSGMVYPGLPEKHTLPVRITPYYLSLIERNNPFSAIGRTVIPMMNEYYTVRGETSDPLCEHNDSPVPGLVHRYPDRVLLLVTGLCASYCRYCTRSHMVGKEKINTRENRSIKSYTDLEVAVEYIKSHVEIRDVIISGGDPLTLGDGMINRILSNLRAIPHVQIIRIGTKVPAVLPQRITTSLTDILKKYHPLFMSLHFTHPAELTPEVKQACTRLADAGIPLGSQTVLLKDVNDKVEILKELFHGLLKNRVRPYYLYQCDPVPGSAHFRTSVEKGLEMIRGLRGHTSGYAIPHYVIDAPGGGGKIPLLPEYYQGKEGDNIILKNFEGKIFLYPDIAD
jgi:lysine 2,3-aminomutase